MAFEIPDTFRSESEDYITFVPLRKFAEEHKEAKIRVSKGRDNFIKEIEEFANTNAENLEKVEAWLDDSVCFGRKEVYLHEIENDNGVLEKLRSEDYIEKCLSGKIKTHRHISGNTYGKNMEVCNYCVLDSEVGKVLRILACKMINTFDVHGHDVSRLYPIVITIYLEKKMIEIRVKSKAYMFEYENLATSANINHAGITAEKVAINAMDDIVEWLGINVKTNAYKLSDRVKGRIYKLMIGCIDTPTEILDALDRSSGKIIEITEYFKKNICELNENETKYFIDDLKTVFEKYMAITRKDTSIFTKSKKMYPVRLVASDTDTSKVDQTAAGKKPLQSRPIFYNNKSMICSNEKCDGIQFIVRKEVQKRDSDSYFFKIVAKKGFCIVSWNEYLKEDDVNYVLFKIINL